MILESDMRPVFDRDVSQILAEASRTGVAVEIIGAGSKRGIGRPTNATHTISTRTMRGLAFYEPAEMVMSARAGTAVAEIQTILARQNQMLAFEPPEFAGLLGTNAAGATIGSVFAMNASGSRRISAGAARDHLIGVRAVSGTGEVFKSGGRVMKNVTGYDLARGLAGSWGTLALLTEVTFKVAPVPPATTTLVLFGLADEIAVEVLCAVMGTPYEVSAAVHIQKSLVSGLEHAGLRSQDKSITAIRLENTPASLAYRANAMAARLAPYGKPVDLDTGNSRAFWDELRRMTLFRDGVGQLWRISTAPTKGPKVVDAIRRYSKSTRAWYDWSGGLVWLEVEPTADAGAADIRRVVATYGGHATLFRAEAGVRAAVDVFQPLSPSVLALSSRLKTALDPAGILGPGRMTTAF
jgi:glycolate oxidase FAD binding subunit